MANVTATLDNILIRTMHRVGMVLLAAGLVLLTASALAGPAAAVGPGDAGISDETAAGSELVTDHNRTTSIVYDVDLPAEGEERISLTIEVVDAPDASLAFRLRGSDVEVTEAYGFVEEGNALVTTGETHNATVTVNYDPSEQLVSPVRDDFVATPEWALFRVMLDVPAGVNVTERVDPVGIRGETFVFVGKYETYERQVGEDRIVLVAPDAADFADHPEDIADILEETSRYLRIGAREERVVAIAAPEGLRRGGLVGQRGGEFWVSADIPLSWNTWTHEYIHLRQDRIHFSSAHWLVEGEARYYQHLVSYKHRHLEHRGSTGFDAFQSQLRTYTGHEEVSLEDPRTWEQQSDYEKGARVLAAIDAEIRQRTDGERDYRHVMHRLNRADRVTAASFRAAVNEVAGEPMDDVLDAYVSGTKMPTVPADPDPYRTGDLAPDIAYNVTDVVVTDAPAKAAVPGTPVFTNESVTVSFTIDNDGIDPLLYPTVAVTPPADWTVEGISIAGDGWEIEETMALGVDVTPDIESVLTIQMVVPTWPVESAVIGLEIADHDGEHIKRAIQMTPVRPVEAKLTVDEPIHEPGTEVTLDANKSDIPRDVVTYDWDLTGDGTFDRTTDDPTLTERFDPGAREVTVRVTNDIGVWGTDTVWVNTTDTPVISVEELIVTEADETFEIPVNVSNEHGGISVVWELPDGNTTTGEPGVFRASPGWHELGVSAVDEFGGTNGTMIEIISVDRPGVLDVLPRALLADVETPLRVVVEKEVGDYWVSWELPDGERKAGSVITVDLPPGHHNVTIHIVDEFGFTANETRTVTVSDVPTVSLSGPEWAVANDSVTFSALVENEVGDVETTWYIGSERVDTGQELTHSFEPGEYDIKVTATDEYGFSSTSRHELHVEAPDEQPGFGASASAAALLGGVLLWWYRSRLTN